ncbi:immunity 22 family protein [Bacillus sp. REN10]|uniref:immunity 22 family protein n=1 Tax=Bacillus sp. REN10 TaxID=2782541 RepID=UPI00193C428B|nr:immunity 22 family protein [Bacillus sp. REN10]
MLMEENHMVSIWIGRVEDEEKVDKLMEYAYDEEGEAIPSEFLRISGIDDAYIDEDFVEVSFQAFTQSLASLLEEHSYSDIFLPKLLQRFDDQLTESVNMALLIYHFEFNGAVSEVMLDGIQLFYLGAFPFEKESLDV